MPNTASERITENVLLTAIARMSMALSLPALGFVAYLFNANLEQKFEAQDKAIAAQATASENQSRIVTARVESVERIAQAATEQAGMVNNQLSVLKSEQASASVSNEKFQQNTLTRLDRLSDSLTGLSNAVSALTAVTQSMLENNRDRPRSN